MKYCIYCGTALDENSKFCFNCGKACSTISANTVCPSCGSEVKPSNMFCQNCGAKVNENPTFNHNNGFGLGDQQRTVNVNTSSTDSQETINTVAKVLMVICTIVLGLYIIPLCWCIPMTVSLSNKIKKREKISTGFKICILIFVSTISGILLLCRKEDEYKDTY